jgi:hypothetical protein
MRSFDCVKKASELKDLKEPFCYSSLPSYLYSLCTIHLEDNEVIFPKLTHNQYQFIRKSAIAGRIETFDKPPTRYDEEIMSLDVTSMYPYSMFCAPVGFGCGAISQGKMTEAIAEALHSDFNENLDFTHKGYYTVNIDQSNLIQGGKSPFICHKDKAGHNWSSYNIDTIYQNDIVLCTNDIKVLLKLNCSVEFIMGAEYITFSHKIPNFEIFGWMSEFMTKKNFQSMQPKNLQNASELSICKIALNSMSGKFMQRIYEMIRVQIRNHHYLSYISQSKDMIPDSESVVGCINRDMCVIEYKRKPECITNIKPIQVGADIYSFSREYMYLNLIHPLGIRASLYTDTDSVKLLARDYIYIKNILENALIPHNEQVALLDTRYKDHPKYKEGSKIFGGFANELEKNNHSYIIDKKEWGVFNVNATGYIDYHEFSFKGVSPASIVIQLDNPLVSQFITMNSHSIAISSQQLALEYDINNQLHRFDNPPTTIRVFENLKNGLPQYFMSTKFIRDMVQNTVKVTYGIKKVTPKISN